MQRDLRPLILLVLLVVLAARNWSGVPGGPGQVDRIVYVYDLESDDVTAQIRAALRDVGRTGVMAEAMDLHPDTIQDRDRPALDAAKESQTPCLVAMSGETVVKTVIRPSPEQIRGFARGD